MSDRPSDTWQIDFYRRPLRNESGELLWELIACNDRKVAIALCPQSQASATWLAAELQRHVLDEAERVLPQEERPPKILQAFRPQTFHLLENAAKSLGAIARSTRRTTTLKQYLLRRSREYPQMPEYTGEPYDPLALQKPPPLPLPKELWGESWRFATAQAGDLLDLAAGPIPVRSLPEELLPLNLELPSIAPIPGIVLDGGRSAMRLARWLESAAPVAIDYFPGQPDGLILEAGLVDRWVFLTFEDTSVGASARSFQRQKKESRGLHFLLVQPDSSGMTQSGFWLLQRER